ncbi:hypothetical protein [Ancylobacter defluvii]|uniref:Uncharacterized protein n=1 Tax=Ancylobacter defluvii TaxID=1282440 RepID=A0A9W6K0I1_9HYPH|nr:hypothetical protein [Ancylobacter defluvii]MBS7588265.1 hypothetical protein [Ancylobacter defluvii]GLK86662.1 hypothetical protein GCM10017653_47320 [Ancylobacter defluvii]
MTTAPVITGMTAAERAASSAVVEAREAVGKMKLADLAELAAEFAFEIEGTQRALIEGGFRSTPAACQIRRAAGLWQVSDIFAEIIKLDPTEQAKKDRGETVEGWREKEFRTCFKRLLKGR